MSKQLIVRAAPLVICAFLASCANAPNGQYVPPEALNKPITDLADGIASFGDKVQKETLSSYRRNAREDLAKTVIYAYFTGPTWAPDGPASTPVRDLVCKPRYGHLRISGPLLNTMARGTAVKDVIKAPSDSVGELFKSLGEKYAVDPALTTVPGEYDVWLEDGGKECADQVVNANPFATRDYVGQESGGAIAAGFALLQTVWDVVKPALTAGLQNIDRERRNSAVQQYFAKPENVKAMKDDLEHVEDFLSKEFSLAQRRAAGEAVSQYAAFNDQNAQHWKNAMAAANATGCQEGIRALPKGGPQRNVGIVCLGKVYEALTPALDHVLDAADKLDLALDKTLPKERLSAQIDAVAKIARGEAPDEAQMKALWGALTRYLALYNTVKDVGSDANKKKVNDALDTLKKALN